MTKTISSIFWFNEINLEARFVARIKVYDYKFHTLCFFNTGLLSLQLYEIGRIKSRI